MSTPSSTFYLKEVMPAAGPVVSGKPSKYLPSPMSLNFGDLTRTGGLDMAGH